MARNNKVDVDIIRRKLATLELLFKTLARDRAEEATQIKTGSLETEESKLRQEILLTEMIQYQAFEQITEAMRKSLL